MAESDFDVIVLGAGIAGLSAAAECSALGKRTAVLDPAMFGGLVLNVNELDGEITGSGADLASELMLSAIDSGAVHLPETARRITRKGSALLVTTNEREHHPKAIIIASGASLRPLHIPGESQLLGRGVSHCADCDGPMLRGKDAVVVGGGDSALQSAYVLSQYCRQVMLVHRSAELRARSSLVERAIARPNVQVLPRARVVALRGENVLGAVVVDVHGRGPVTLECSGIFPFVGLEPQCDFAPPDMRRDASGGLVTDAQLQTTVRHVYAAGAVRAGYEGMVSHARAEGIAAARYAVQGIGP